MNLLLDRRREVENIQRQTKCTTDFGFFVGFVSDNRNVRSHKRKHNSGLTGFQIDPGVKEDTRVGR